MTRETYDGEKAENYERRRSGSLTWRREQEIVESFLALANPSPGSSVLDVPVGTGRFNDLYQTFRLRTIGIDISADMLAQARSRLTDRALLCLGDATRLPLASECIDIAICVRLLHLLDPGDARSTIAELGRVVKDGGHLIIGSRVHRWNRGQNPLHQMPTMAKAAARTWKFRLGRANSRSHPWRRIRRSFSAAQFTIIQEREPTSYPDGSRYALFILKKDRSKGSVGTAIELFGLPGSGKSTLFRSWRDETGLTVVDGFKQIKQLSLWQCTKRAPKRVLPMLLRATLCGLELLKQPARKVVVAAARQMVVLSANTDRLVVFEEGATHEAWRQLVNGHQLSDRLLHAILPVADTTVILDVPASEAKGRLATKRYPGPISRALISNSIDSPLWERATSALDILARVLRASGGRVVLMENDAIETTKTSLEELAVGCLPMTGDPPAPRSPAG